MNIQRDIQYRIRELLRSGPLTITELDSLLYPDAIVDRYVVRSALLLMSCAGLIDVSFHNVVSLRT